MLCFRAVAKTFIINTCQESAHANRLKVVIWYAVSNGEMFYTVHGPFKITLNIINEVLHSTHDLSLRFDEMNQQYSKVKKVEEVFFSLTPVSDSACSGPPCLRSFPGTENASSPLWDCWSSAGFLCACSPERDRQGEKTSFIKVVNRLLNNRLQLHAV